MPLRPVGGLELFRVWGLHAKAWGLGVNCLRILDRAWGFWFLCGFFSDLALSRSKTGFGLEHASICVIDS